MPRRLLVFLSFLSAYLLSYFFRSTNAVIAPDLTRDLGLSASQLGFMTSLFFMAFAAVQLPLGSALDRFGARFVTPALMLAGVAGSLVFAVADSFAALAVGRALIGVGMAGVLMGAFKAFSGHFSPERFAVVSTVFVGLGSLGALAAATPLAYLNEQLGWRGVFGWGALVVLASAALVAWLGRDAPGEGGDAREGGGGFGTIFSSDVFWRIALFNLAVAGSLFAYQSLWAGPYLSHALELGPFSVGNLLLALGIGATVGYFVSGWLSGRLGLLATIASAGGLIAVIQLMLALFPATWPQAVLVGLFALFGFAGSFNLLLFTHVRRTFADHLIGRAVTAANIFGIGGSALLQWGLGVLIGLFPETATGGHPALAYRLAFASTAALCLAAVAAYLPLLGRAPAAAPAASRGD